MNLEKNLHKICNDLRANFVLNDQPISYEDVFKDDGLLPAIARRADQLCALCLGYGIGVSFDEAEGSKLGVRVSFQENAAPNFLRLLCLTDVIIELIQSGPEGSRTPLDELLYD